MTLQDLLLYRRATRHYSSQTIDPQRVKTCCALATLSPTSSNMQMYEMIHITDKDLLRQMGEACLGQGAATTAQQMVVFVTRQDKYRQRAKQLLDYEIENVQRHSPPDRWAHRMKRWQTYYGKYIPLVYAKGFGLIGAVRKLIATVVGWFRPIVHEVSEQDRRVSVHQSCALVAQTFMLAMAEVGYDTCPLGGFDSKRIKHLLNLPRGAEVSLVISCGIREAKGIWGERFRFSLDELYRNI